MTVTADHDLHTLAGPYAMDAVTADERASFAEHLAGCEDCRIEVRELREATARLGLAAAVQPRPELREQTIRAANRTSQLGPVMKPPTAAGQPGSKPKLAAALGRAVGQVRSWRVSIRVGLAAATALVAAAAILGVVTHSAMQELRHSQHQDHMIAAVLNAPDAVMLTARVRTGGTATAVMSRREHAAVLTAHDLEPLPSTEAYEIWLMGPDGTRPAGMLKPQPGGMAGPAVVAGIGRGDMIGLTVEPMTGAHAPTSVLLVLIRARRDRQPR